MGERVIHEIEYKSNLFYIISAFLGAYNRRTDVIARANATDPAEIAALTERLKKSHDKLQAAEDAAQ